MKNAELYSSAFFFIIHIMINFQEYIFDGILWLKIIAEFPQDFRTEFNFSEFDEIVFDFSECHIINGNIIEFFSLFSKNKKELFIISFTEELKTIFSNTKLKYSIKEYPSFFTAYNAILEKRLINYGGKENYFKFRKELNRCKSIENIYYNINENILLINVESEFTLDNEKYLDDIIKETKPNTIIFNFYFINYADSTGLGKLISIHKKFGSKFIVCSCNNNIMRIFKMVKFDQYLNILPSIGDALEYIFNKKYRLSQDSRVRFDISKNELTVFFDTDIDENDFTKIDGLISEHTSMKITLDFSKSKYISSNALSKIVTIYMKVDKKLSIKNVPPPLFKIFKIVKFDKFINISELPKQAKKNIDGIFTLLKKSDSYYLTVFPPQGKGKPVNIQSVIEDMQKKEISNFNTEVIKKIVLQSNRIPYKIEEDKMNLDALIIEKKENNMKAFLFLDSNKNRENPAEPSDLYYKLMKEDIVFGIKKTLADEIILQKIEDKPVLIAEGVNFKKGKPGKIDIKIKSSNNGKPLINDKGKVNFKEISNFHQVKKGELIAQIIPGIPPSPSIDISGKVNMIEELQKLEKISFKTGINTYISENGLELYSAADGIVNISEDGTISVLSLLEINMNIDFRAGNVHYQGNILINGDVKSGFIIEGENIAINGFVEGGDIISNVGNVFVKDGIIGRNKSKIILKNGNLSTSKIIDSEVLVNGNILVENGFIRNSKLTASGNIIISGENSSIIGGIVSAGSMIEAWNIGSPTSSKTELKLDNNAFKDLSSLSKNLSYQIKELDNKQREYEKELEKQDNCSIIDLMKEDNCVKLLNSFSHAVLTQSKLKKELESIESLLIMGKTELNSTLNNLKKKKNSLESLSPQKFMGLQIMEKLLESNISDKDLLLGKIEREYLRQREIKELERKIGIIENLLKFRKNANIIVHGYIYPGVKITFEDKLSEIISEKKSSIRFFISNNKLTEKKL